jgi:hypothetical protein
MPEAGTPKVDPPRSGPDRAAEDAAHGEPDAEPTTALDEPHLDLVSETLQPDGLDESSTSALVSSSPSAEPDDDTGSVIPAPGADGVAPEADVEAERDKWRERAILWRERALAAEVVAKELGTHLADMRENLEDVRDAMHALTEQRPAIGAPSKPRSGWRDYVARLLDLDR